jgi:two-component system response regulator HydG
MTIPSRTDERILVVDDDPAVRIALQEALEGAGFAVSVANSALDALAMIATVQPHAVVADVRMPEMTGIDLLRELRSRGVDADVLLMTAFDDMPTVVEAIKHGAADFLVKPLDLDELQRVLGRILSDRSIRSCSNPTGAAAIDGILVGRDPGMIEIYKRIGQAAVTRASVLVRGESGTGKELVARAIHDHSEARDEPFVPVNCAALPTALLESELFGHVRGAFTGAVSDRKGRFAQARGGTIFLDEVGDTSPELQSKLLRVLQDRQFQPVGSDGVVSTGARVIAATHQPLEAMISERRFREDLYYRLRVVEITLPPLRERLSDLPLLATHILQRAASALGTAPAVLATGALRRLAEHSWPGNVRELENCLMRAIVVAPGGVIHAEHVSLSSPASRSGPAVTSLQELERTHVANILRVAQGHKGRAAELLGVSRPRLNRMIEKYGLE